jgi:hypothetical protein
MKMLKKQDLPKEKNEVLQILLFGLFFLVSVAVVLFFLWDYVTVVDSAKTEESSNLASANQVKLNAQEFRLPENYHPRGLNLVFLADQYGSWDEYENDIDGLMSELRTIEPWASYQHFNIYKINPREAGVCYVKSKDEAAPVLRCNSEVNNYLNNLPLDKFRLIVLSRQDFQSWANVVRNENSGIFFSIPKPLREKNELRLNTLLFAHLLGHTFGLKDEEYFVLAKAGGAPHAPDGPNCAPNATTAEKWWGGLTKEYPEVGYFKGCCGSNDYIKPTESSIMNLNSGDPIAYDYGQVSLEYLQKVLLYCFSPEGPELAKADSEFFRLYPDFKDCET